MVWLGKFLVIITALLYSVRLQTTSVSATLSNSVINANSIYTFNIIDGELSTSNGSILLGFPSSLYTISSPSCYNYYNSSLTFPCVAVNSSFVRVTYTIPTLASTFISLSVSTIKNPSSKQSVNLTYVFTNNSAATPTAYTLLSSLTPDVLTNCSILFNPNTIFTSSTATFTIANKNNLDVGARIYLVFPESWTNSVTGFSTPFLTTPACSKVSGAPLATTLSCTFFPSYQSILLQSAISSAISTPTTLSFSVSGLRTPPTTNTANYIRITTSLSNTNEVDSSSCQVSAATAKVVTLSTTSSFTVGVNGELVIKWTNSAPYMVGDVITLNVPADYITYSTINGYLMYGSTILSVSTVQASTTQITITITGSSISMDAGGSMTLGSYIIACWVDVSVRIISFSTSRGSYGMQTGSISITPVVNTLTNVGVSSNNLIVSSALAFTIRFNTTNALAVSSSFRIQFPASSILPLTGNSPVCTLSSSRPSFILSSISCTLTSSLLTVPTFLSSGIPSSTTLTLTVSNAFVNPSTSEPTPAFIITTYSAGGFAVDQSSSLGYQAEMGTISNIAIVPSSFTVGQQALYELTYTLTRVVKSGAVIIVGIPVEISVGVSATYTYSIDGAAYASITPTSLSNTTYTNLTFNGIVNAQLSAGSIIKIRFNTLTNPLSMRPSSSFTVWTLSNGYGIEYISSGLSITMTTPTTFKELKAIVSNPTNGATQDYTFYFKLSVGLNVGDIMRLQIVPISTGNELSFISSINSCFIKYQSNSVNNTCSLSLNTLTVTLSQSLVDTTGTIQYQLVASSIILARTPALTSNFKLSTFSGNYGVHSESVNSMTNTIPNKIKSLTLSFGNPSRLNSYQPISATVQTFNGVDLFNGEYLVLTVPSLFTRSNLTVASICTTASFTCSIYNSDSLRIKVEKSASFSTTGLLTSFAFTVHQDMYVSPQGYNYDTAYFYIDTFTATGLKIDTTDPIGVTASAAVFSRSCGGKCFQCLSSSIQNCTSCYSYNFGVISGNDFGNYNILNPNNQCVDVCGDGFYVDAGSNCVACVSPCQICTGVDRCTTCVGGYYYLSTAAVTQRCKSECPARYFASSLNNSCTSCSTNCYNCSSTASTCTACTVGSTLFLENGACVSSCALGYYEDASTNKCLACDAGCTGGCGANASDCNGCKDGYFKANSTSTECVNSCPQGSVKNMDDGVCGCLGGCATCAGTLTNCTSCNSSAIFYQSQCVTSCPAQTYPTSSSTCLPCADSRCSDCNASACNLCSSNYYLYSGTCLDKCPAGTRISNYACILCPSGCRSCLANGCTQCFSGYLVQGNECVSSCGNGYINFNATSCLSQCPTGYTNISNKCESNTSEQVVTVTDVGRIIPFPFTIAYVLVLAVSIGMRCLYERTLLASVLMSLGSVVEVMSIFTLVIVGAMEKGGVDAGIVLVIIGIVVTYICNVVGLVMVYKVLSSDHKFVSLYKKAVVACVTIRVISGVVSHKFHEISFSNIFGVRAFSMKIENINKLYPFNVLLIVSLFVSVFVVIGAGITSYSVQNLRLSSSTFIQSVDCIIAVVFNMIPTVLVLRRQPNLYQNQVGEQAKRYQTHDQLDINNESGGMDEFFIDESRILGSKVSNTGQRRKNNFFRTGDKESGEDPYETPLDKKVISGIKPISTVPKRDPEESSEALVFGDKNQSKIGRSSEDIGEDDDIEEIQLEEPTGDNQGNPGMNRKTKQSLADKTDKNGNPLLNYTGYDLDPALLALPEGSDEFKKLPSETKAKIRLAKANMQINKNTQNMKKDTLDVEQIQLSPKKNKDDKRDSISDELGNSSQNLLNDSMKKINEGSTNGKVGKNKNNELNADKNNKNKGNNNSIGNGNDIGNSKDNANNTNGSLLIEKDDGTGDGREDSKRKGKDQKNKSLSKSKEKQGQSKSQQKSLSKSKSLEKVQGQTQSLQSQNVFDSNKQSKQQQNNPNKQDEDRFIRNHSQQMNKRLGKEENIKTTKSQNLKKKKNKLMIGDSSIPMNENDQNQSENDDEDHDSQEGDFEEDQPTLPIFKHRNKDTIERKGESDGLEKIGEEKQRENNKKKSKNKNKKKGQIDHRSVDLNDHSNMNNLRNQKGNKTIPNQQPDDLPHLHSSQQLSNLIVINKRNNPRSSREIDFSNDDSSIYKKIYNDETETLKSVQGDNMFHHDISPSQFNAQNQRFEEIEAENDLPVPATIEIDSNGDEVTGENREVDDGDMEGGSRIQRYSSSNRIDYDSVLSKRVNNDRIKQLEKIYLPRLEVTKPGRKKK